MKSYIVTYTYGLGDFLDEKRIIWTALPNDQISIECKDDNTFFRLALDFADFKQSFS